jgi:hypothetical protein
LEKNRGRKGRKFYWRVLPPLSVGWFFTVEKGLVFLRRSQPAEEKRDKNPLLGDNGCQRV